MTEEVKTEAQQLLRAGERDKALALLQETYRISRDEAFLLIDALERETEARSQFANPNTPTDVDQLKREVVAMLKEGRRAEVVRHITQQRGLSLPDALVLIGEATRETGKRSAGGCLRFILKGIGVFFMIVSGMLLLAALVVYVVQELSIENSDRVEGFVVDMKADNYGAEAPVVEFVWNDKSRRYQSTYHSAPPDYQRGEQVFVFVNRDDPDNVTIDTFVDRWAMIVGLASIGGFLLLIAIVFLYFGGRRF